ncbi:hypothetical protein CCACVL1_01840, partial [Corchorus capsularis]
ARFVTDQVLGIRAPVQALPVYARSKIIETGSCTV